MNRKHGLGAIAAVLMAVGIAEAAKAKCIVAVNILDEKIQPVSRIRCFPGANIRWIVVNGDEVPYDVFFDTFTLNGQPDNPTNKQRHPVRVKSGQPGQVPGARVLSSVKPGANGTMYEYKIRIHSVGPNSKEIYVLDPELEVVPPDILIKPK